MPSAVCFMLSGIRKLKLGAAMRERNQDVARAFIYYHSVDTGVG